MDNLMELMPQFTKLKRVEYKFTATKENIERMTECVKDLMSEKSDINIEVYRDGDEIIFEIFEI